MVSLLDAFDRNREQLKLQLAKDTDPDKVVRETKEFLDSLFIKYRAEAEQEQSFQTGLMAFIIDLLKASVSTLAAANDAEIWQREPRASEVSGARATSNASWLWYVLQLVIVVALTGWSWMQQEYVYFVLAVALLAIDMAMLIRRLLNRRKKKKNLSVGTRRMKEEPKIQARVQVNIELFMHKLADAILTADKTLAEVKRMNEASRQPEAKGLESDNAVLDFFQSLLEAKETHDADFALKQTRTVPYLLEKHNIKMEIYSGSNEDLFEFMPSLNPDSNDCETIRPALLKGKHLLKRGLVTEPSSKLGKS